MKRSAKLAIAAFSLLSFSFTASALEVENNAEISKRLQGDKEFIFAIAGMIVGNGHTCDSISSIKDLDYSRGFKVYCNNWTRGYRLEGSENGRWNVEKIR